jgi:hypothetical protein
MSNISCDPYIILTTFLLKSTIEYLGPICNKKNLMINYKKKKKKKKLELCKKYYSTKM